MRGMGLALAAALAFIACATPSTFVCESDDQCARSDAEGTCEAGLCAFTDPDCASGKRYGGLSGERAGECVPTDGVATETSGSSGDDGGVGSTDEGTSGGDTLAVSADASAGDTSPSGDATGPDPTSPTTGATGSSSTDSGGLEDAVHNYVFVTSTAHTISTFGGLAGADAWCSDLAADAGLPGQYVAWLSTASVNAIDRIGDAQGWVRVDGRPFARSPDALVSGEHFFPIRLDEYGEDRLGANVVTATGGDGTYFGPSDCGGWTSAVGEARRAFSDALGDAFTTNYDGACAVSIRIYCFGIDDAVDLPIVLPPPGRRAFVTADSIAATAGIDAFDARCQDDAQAAGVPGTFAAFVSTSTTSAADRFDLGGEPWSLLNDVPVVENAADLAAPNATLLAPIWLAASGMDEGGGTVWQGSTAPSVAAAADENCGDWSLTTGQGQTGARARSAVWWGTSTVACTDFRRVLCLEE